jgi:hypothetical protein
MSEYQYYGWQAIDRPLVKRREPSAKILVVATHGGPQLRQPDIDRQELWDLFGEETVVDFFLVDSKPDAQSQRKGIDELKSAIAQVAASLPIVLPLADLIGVTRQTAVLAYIFGDGFSNLAYPTNPVLLISLGLTVVSYPKWIRWTAKLWLWVILVTVVFLGIAVAINFGPF